MKRAAAFILGGLVFGGGLALSGMARPEVVLSFLAVHDLGLLLVMGGAIAVVLPVYQLWTKPLLATETEGFQASAGQSCPMIARTTNSAAAARAAGVWYCAGTSSRQ